MGEILTTIVSKTDNAFLLFCVIVAVVVVSITLPLGMYYLKRMFDKKNS